ncbi:hypothetical protein I79_000600 [Cricetulus griseus]|uniref:Uncharacterized protein n=1 Tax=Cricetulus griseus TaxID=10029 RepID=G3GSI6_CRIGR|nr:hypothetical protein I79_000600 [Cricetulus griseus]
MMVHAFDPELRGRGRRSSVSSRPAGSTWWVLGQLGLHSEILPQKKLLPRDLGVLRVWEPPQQALSTA